MSRYSRENDIVLGTPVAGRTNEALEVLIGFFVNTLVLRTQINHEQPFSEFLRHNKTMVLDAFSHQDIPFEMLVEELKPERSSSHSPLFQVMFTLQNKNSNEFTLPGLTITPIESEQIISKFDLSVIVAEESDNININWEYCRDLFNTETIKGMAESFQVLLQHLITDIHRPLHTINCIANQETDPKALQTLSQPIVTPLIHQKIEQYALTQGQEIALVFGADNLTYAELNTQANQLAHYLIALGVKNGDFVGICVERSLDMMVSVIAVLKAGAAYLPVDPSHPSQRSTYMLQDSNSQIVISQSDLMANINLDIQIVSLDDHSTEHVIQQQPESNPEQSNLTVDDLAYAIYTSGSTGQPKGVKLDHGGIINLLEGSQQVLPLSPQSSILHLASFAFDAATWDWIMALGHGAKLHIIPQETAISPNLLDDYVNTSDITLCLITPALLPLLDHRKWERVKSIIIGGDVCSQSTAQLWSQQRQLFNAYGPSECTVCTTIGKYQPSDTWLHIGQPLYGQQVYILDEHHNQLPDGAIGELCVAGHSVGQGYINNSKLTQQSFITSHQVNDSRIEHKRGLYKTGDLVRRLPDGNLLFLGRKDSQIKVRGFRIELGEIQNQLEQLQNIASVAVIVAKDRQQQNQIVAYYTSESSQSEVDLRESIKQQLTDSLPHYMTPSVFVRLDTLPLNPNGKVDTLALSKRDVSPCSENKLPLEGETEHTLAQIWASTLNISPSLLGSNSHFLSLGGHSLLLVKLLNAISEHWQSDIKMSQLFATPYLHDMAYLIDSANPAKAITEILPVDRTSPHKLSYAQNRLWFIEQLAGHSAQFNMPASFEIIGQLDLERLNNAIAHVIQRHELLRCHFTNLDGEARLNIQSKVSFQFEVSDIRSATPQAQQQTLATMMENDLITPFDLSQASLFRGTLIRTAQDKQVLLFNMHHIISDGWSVEILFNDLISYYNALKQHAPLPDALPIQYVDYAHWQNSWLQGDRLEIELGFWEHQLTGIPALHNLPLDYTRPNEQDHTGAALEHSLSAQLSQQVVDFCLMRDITPFVFLQSAFAALIARYSCESDIVMSTPAS